jgi:3-oxoisoapionate kinase
VMEALTLAGLRTALFLAPPTHELLRERFAGLRALGLAGVSRSWSPAQMDAQLPGIFEQLRAYGAPLTHYKVCSTFDSAPEVGSIGRAAEIGAARFGTRPMPLLVGAPALRRYTLFGNLFATAGAQTYRLDRHPTMAHHPVTPMRESDLRAHLAHQTTMSVALFDILQLSRAPGEVDRRYAELLDSAPDVVLFDVLDESHLATIGRLIWGQRGDAPSFAVGSSGVEYALVAHWRASGMIAPPPPVAPAGPASQIIVVSGSCSPETERQIGWAAERGFGVVALDSAQLIDPAEAAGEVANAISHALSWLARGQSVVLHTSLGPRDPRIAATGARLAAMGAPREQMAERIGTRLGQILAALLRQTAVRRAVVAGGDTSGYVTRQIGIYALEMVTPIAPGSPLCRAYANDPAIDGLQIALKGGQVGGPNYFECIQRGEAL